VLIAAATVYGRYHYLADAAAGLAMALLAAGIVWGVERRGKLHTGAKLMWRAQSCVPRRG